MLNQRLNLSPQSEMCQMRCWLLWQLACVLIHSRSQSLFLRVTFWFTPPFINLDPTLTLFHCIFILSSVLLGSYPYRCVSLNILRRDLLLPHAAWLLQEIFLFCHCSIVSSFRGCGLFKNTLYNQGVDSVLTKLKEVKR